MRISTLWKVGSCEIVCIHTYSLSMEGRLNELQLHCWYPSPLHSPDCELSAYSVLEPLLSLVLIDVDDRMLWDRCHGPKPEICVLSAGSDRRVRTRCPRMLLIYKTTDWQCSLEAKIIKCGNNKFENQYLSRTSENIKPTVGAALISVRTSPPVTC